MEIFLGHNDDEVLGKEKEDVDDVSDHGNEKNICVFLPVLIHSTSLDLDNFPNIHNFFTWRNYVAVASVHTILRMLKL